MSKRDFWVKRSVKARQEGNEEAADKLEKVAIKKAKQARRDRLKAAFDRRKKQTDK